MWLNKAQASPASSTSTVDQQEIIFDEQQLTVIHVNQQQHQHQPQLQTPHLNQIQSQQHPQQQTYMTQRKQTNQTPVPPTQHPPPQTKQNSKQQNHNNTKSAGKAKYSPTKKPKLYNPSQQLAPWKSLQHHFLRHNDVKYRPEKRMTMAELGNEVLLRRNGWKVHHLVGQLTDLIQNETQIRDKLDALLELFVDQGAKRIHDLASNCHKLPEQYATLLQSQRSYGTNEFKPELIVTKLDDLLRGDLQRSALFNDQLKDCRDLVVRITNEHRDRVGRITSKFNKRIQL